MTNVTEMTHQELIDGAKGRWGLGKAAVCEAELLRRLGAAVSAQDEHELGDPLWPIYQKFAETAPKPLPTYSGWLRTIAQKLEREFFAAAPAQEPRQDLYVISSTGDGAQTIIVLESKLKQSVHDTYCACGLEWPKCADEVITETLAKVDDEEEWTREYPAYRRHVWSDHGEDYTVTIMRVTAAQEQPVEPVAEPASTGEPECGQFTGRYSHCKKPRGHDGSCNPLHGIVFVAARPSEPSANFMQKIGGTCLKHGEYNGQQCPKWPDCISAAAPQPVSGMYISETKPRKVDDARITEIFNREPVSGDAPKVEDAKK